jgi:hypothetical protein
MFDGIHTVLGVVTYRRYFNRHIGAQVGGERWGPSDSLKRSVGPILTTYCAVTYTSQSRQHVDAPSIESGSKYADSVTTRPRHPFRTVPHCAGPIYSIFTG